MANTAVLEKDQVAIDQSAVLAVIEGMKRANFEKNAEAFADAFTADADVANLAPPLVHRGIDIAEKKKWFDGWDGPVEIDSRDFKVTVDGDHAFAYGFMKLTGHKKGPEVQVSFWMRETLCLERTGNGWKIVHEHTSVPFYMDASLRPAFDLEP